MRFLSLQIFFSLSSSVLAFVFHEKLNLNRSYCVSSCPSPYTNSNTASKCSHCIFQLHAESESSKDQESKQKVTVDLNQNQGGYTLKQRLREEIDSPFRKVRLVFFASSVGSALTALYFSLLNTIKAVVGGYADSQPLEEALTSDLINLSAAVICGLLAYREYKLGQSNLDRIARGGKLASLVVEPAKDGKRLQMKSYRRASRVVVACGGSDYLSSLARSMASDQLKDTNVIPQKLVETDVVVVPVLLQNLSSDDGNIVGDTRFFWNNEIEAVPETGRNFDIKRADSVISFPTGPIQWGEYLESEIETAVTQGYDVMKKGIFLIVKKNGKILRRATGLPPFGELIGTMEIMDGSKFGMPGDSERYESS